MSQYLVSFFNDTDSAILLRNLEHEWGDNRRIAAREVLVVQGRTGHFNIPDNSDPKTRFPLHHMEVWVGGNIIFSFWNNPVADHYRIYNCPGTNWSMATEMPGTSALGNYANVMIVFRDGKLYAQQVQIA